jgi:hypothetical protein
MPRCQGLSLTMRFGSRIDGGNSLECFFSLRVSGVEGGAVGARVGDGDGRFDAQEHQLT